MDALAFDLKSLTLTTGEGAHVTHNQRHRGLQLIARDLASLGYKLPSMRSIKPKHISALVESWKAAGLSTGTIKNRMSWVRYWATKARKTSVLPRNNSDLGIPRRQMAGIDKARTASAEQLTKLPAEWMRLAVRLQMAFGLRLEESLKFRPGTADQGGYVALQASWCKGGRARAIPLVHDRQRHLLQEIHDAAGDGSLMPTGMTYKQARNALENATWGADIRNMHGHRHWYAQWRYRTLMGAPCPAAGGKAYANMTMAERRADHRVRLQVSRELGHNRVGITDAYLGARSAAKGKRHE